MSDDRADLILNMLRAIRAKLDEHDRKFEEVIVGLGRVEREFANPHGDFASMHVRLDDVNQRLDRVERRLDPVDESTSRTDV
jgi:tetrahydromethanopterin S-methyltransferase subunit G